MTVDVRPLRPEDCAGARDVADRALRALAAVQGWTWHEPTEQGRARGVDRVAHLQRTDPGGCWAAVREDGTPCGVALALRRGPLWFLSLLMVDPDLQGRGVGRRLLDGALRTAEDAPGAVVMATSDVKALRRYSGAGFALHAGYYVTGTVDRALLPAVPQVREGDVARDADLVEGLATRLRGAPYGPDLGQFAVHGTRLLVLPGRGFAVLRPGLVVCLGAEDEQAAEQLLWAALAEAGPEVEVELVLGRQQWAVRTALAARLSVRPDTSLCLRGTATASPLHLVSGAYG